jgi:hypothetical protein
MPLCDARYHKVAEEDRWVSPDEVVVVARGRGCVGWGDYEYNGDAGAGRGVGDDRHSWGYDGWSGVKRHAGVDEAWGVEWQPGDVIGCFANVR